MTPNPPHNEHPQVEPETLATPVRDEPIDYDESLRESQLDLTPALPKLLDFKCPQCGTHRSVIDEGPWAKAPCQSCGSQLNAVETKPFDVKPGRGCGVVAGQRIGRYELLEKLGAGGFGEVWKADDTQLQRTVAVKFPHRGQLDADDLDKFLREARAAAQIRHPNIVPVHDAGMEGDYLCIVSDFIEGLSLDKWLDAERPSCRETAELCATIAAALHHAHERGIVHRDLKPSNIMIDCRGEPHIMDFGLAKRDTGEQTTTIEGQILGTPAYMSPEQARGQAHIADRRADIYSLGVIIFELLTGERPFRGNLQMLLKQVIQDEPPSPRKLDSHVPRDLETISLKCLQKEPLRRYQTSQAVADELSRHLSGVPILARPVSSVERFNRWCQRNPLVAASIALAMAGLLFGLIAAVVGYVRTSRALAVKSQALVNERKVVDEMFTQVSEDVLLNQPGMQRVRKDLLQRARKYYELFLAESGDDASLKDDLGLAHFRLGRITEETQSPGEALPFYESAKEIQERLLTATPKSIERLRALGDTLNARGRIFYNQQKLDAALESQTAALDIRKQLTELTPDAMEAKRTLANTYMNIGLIERDRGSPQARELIEQAQSIRKELLSANPHDPKVRRDLALGYFNLAKKVAWPEMEKADTDRMKARPWYDLAQKSIVEARQLFEELSAADHADLSLREYLAFSYCVDADLLSGHERFVGKEAPAALDPAGIEAIGVYGKGRSILAELVERNPDVTGYKLSLAEMDLSIAQMEQEQKHGDAMADFERAEAVLTPLMAECGDTARYLHDLTSTLYGLGNWHTDATKREKATNDLKSLIQHMEILNNRVPKAELQRARKKLDELNRGALGSLCRFRTAS